MPRAYDLIRGMQTGGGSRDYSRGNAQEAGMSGTSNVSQTGSTSGLSAGSATADDFLAQLLGQGGIAGGIGQNSSSWQSQIAMPPALELLAEMRARRESDVTRAKTLSDILFNNTPQGQANYLGFEPGGVADVLLGILTGNGPEAAGKILPQGQRAVRRTNVNIPSQPPVGQEFGDAQSMAQAILDAIRTYGTGGSSSTPTYLSAPAGAQ